MKTLLNTFKISFYTLVFLLVSIFYGCSKAPKLNSMNEPVLSDDLYSKNITSFAMDSKGFIWIGTGDGVSMFDGNQYKSYFHVEKDSLSLISNLVNKVFIDEKKRLWIGTENGICYYEGGGKFMPVRIDGEHSNVNQIIETSDSSILINLKGCVYSYNADKNIFEKAIDDKKDGGFNFIYPDNAGGIWKINTENILHYSKDFKLLSKQVDMTKSNIISVASFENYVWISTRIGGVKQLNLVNGQVSQLSSLLPILPIKSVYRKGKLVMTCDDGIYNYDLKSKTLSKDSMLNWRIPGSYSQDISCLYNDSKNNLWVGTSDNGYKYIKFSNSVFDKYKQSQLFENTQNKSVTKLRKDDKGNIWGLYSNGQIFRLDSKSKEIQTFQTYELSNSPYFKQKALNLIVSGDYVYVTSKTRLSRYQYNNNQLTGNYVKKFGQEKIMLGNVAASSSGKIAIVTNRKKIIIQNNANEETKEISVDDNSFGSNAIISFLFNKDELLVCDEGMQFGIADINKMDYRKLNPTFKNKKPAISPNCIFVTDNNTAWIGTNSGLCKFDIAKNEVRCVNSLFSVAVSSILEDKNKKLWLSTDQGIIEYDTGEDKTYHYSLSIGNNNYFSYNTESACIYNDSALMFGHSMGISIFSPSEIKRESVSPLIIERLIIRQKMFKFSGVDLLNVPAKRINLKHNENDIIISFTSVNFDKSPLTISYMMEGFDSHWNFADSRRQAIYPNLPPGTYTFKVKTGYFSDSNHKAENKLVIHVKRAPWASYLAIFFYLIVLLSLIYYINRLYLRIRTEKLTVLLTEKEKEHEHKISQMNMSFFANITHEFRNPLTMILGPIMMLKKDRELPKDVHRLLEILSQSVNQMLKLVDQMLDFNKLDNDVLKLKVGKYDVSYELQNWIQRFTLSAKEKDIEIKSNSLDCSCFAILDKDKLDKIIGNILSNALKYTSQYGKITISASIIGQKEVEDIFKSQFIASDRFLYITISDNGPGIPENEINEVFDRYFQGKLFNENWSTGLGLYYVKQLVKLHKGMINVKNRANEGVVFYFALPIDESAYEVVERVNENDTYSYADQSIINHNKIKPQMQSQKDKLILLIVDDNVDMAYYLRSIFEDEYIVINKYDAESVLSSIEEINPDVIIMDVIMNGMNGYELCKSLKINKTYSHIPIILLTGKSNVEDQVEGLSVGANAYVTKPFNPLYLLALVHSQIQNVQNIRELLKTSTNMNKDQYDEGLSLQDKAFMNEVYELMDKMIQESEVNINELCLQIRISRSKLFYKLKSLTGETPNNFFKKYKLNRAAELLRQGKYNVSEVAYETGFSTVSHFSISFKKEFGINPSEYI